MASLIGNDNPNNTTNVFNSNPIGGSIDPSSDIVCKSVTADTITASTSIVLNNADVHDNVFTLSRENTSDLVTQGLAFESKSGGTTKHSGLFRKAGGGHYLLADTSTPITGSTDITALGVGALNCGDIKCLSLTTDRDLGTGVDTDYINLGDFGMNSTGSVKVNDNTLIVYGNVDSNASIDTDGGATIKKNLNVGTKTGIATFSDTRQATDASTGAVVINGGVGIAKNVYVGSSGQVNVLSTTESQSTYSGAILVNGGIGVQKTIYANQIRVSSNSNSSTTNSGAMVVYGGEAITRDLYVGGTVKTINTADSTDVSTGSIIASGGIATAKTLYVGGDIKMSGTGNMYYPSSGGLYHDQYGNMYFQSGAQNTYSWHVDSNSNGGSSILFQVYNNIAGNPTCRINGNNDSSSPSNGAVIITGGVGIGKNVMVGGDIAVSSGTDATSVTSGSIRTTGGISCEKSLYVGGGTSFGNVGASGYVYTTKTNDATDSLTGALYISGGMSCQKNLFVGSNIIAGRQICGSLPTNKNKQGVMGYDGTNDSAEILGIEQGVTYKPVGVNSNSQFIVRNTTEASATNTASSVVLGGLGVAKKLCIGGTINAINTEDSTDASTGSVVASGGIGVTKKLYVAGQGNFTAGTASTSKTTGSVLVTGGIGCTGTVNCSILGADSQVLAQATTQSTNVSTGSLVVSGGAGFAKQINVGGIIKATNTADATDSITGSLLVIGGIGLSKSMYVGDGIYFPTVGGTATKLNFYETYTHTTNMTGCFSLSNINFYLVRVGNMVTMRYTTQSGTYSASQPEYAVTVLPARFRPATDVTHMTLITNNGNSANGSLVVYADGNLYFYYNNPSPVPFTAGTCGWTANAVSWCL